MKTLVIVAFAVACGPIVINTGDRPGQHACLGGTSGDRNVACLAWESTSDLTTPIAAGSQSSIEIASNVAVAQVESGNLSIARFTLSGTRVDVQAYTPGTADLILEDARGYEIDRATVVVAENVDLATDVYGGATHVAVLAGISEIFHVSTLGPGGVGTVGVGAVAFSTQGSATLSPWLLFKDGDETSFWGYAGQGRVLARAGSAVAALDVDFLEESAVTSIDLRVASIAAQFDGTAVANVVAVAQTPYGPLYGATCDWSISPYASVEQGASLIDHAAGSQSQLILSQPGRMYTATCAIGAQTALVNLRY